MTSHTIGSLNLVRHCLVRALYILMGAGALFIWTAPTGTAQPAGLPLLKGVSVEGNLAPFSQEELSAQIRTRANSRFLGITGVTPGVWFYNLGGDGEGGLARAIRRAGEAPATFDPAVLEDDVERLEALYRQEGFLNVVVEAHVDTLAQEAADEPAHVRVAFVIDAGTPTYVRFVRYEGLDVLGPEERKEWIASSMLALRAVDADSFVFTGVGQRFAERELLGERQAMLDYLRHNGFALVNRDSIQAIVFGMPDGAASTAAPDSVDVLFRVSAGERFLFGDVAFMVNGPEVDVEQRVDTLALGDGIASVQMDGERRLSNRLLRRSLQFQPGDPYDFEALLATKRRLERTGVFTFSDIIRLAPDSTRGGMLRAPHRVSLHTRKRHGVRLEGFVLQRSGLLGAESEELALGAGVSYRNANLAGGGEAFTLSTTGSVAGDFTEGFPTAQLEIGSTLALPSLVAPFGFIERAIDPLDSRTQVSLGFLIARREALGVIIRGRASLGLRLEARHNTVRSSFLDLIDFTLSDPDTLMGFSERFLSFVEDTVAVQFVLDDYTQPQINSAVRYTFRSTTANPFRRDQGHTFELSAEVGGNLSQFLDRFVFTPDSLEGSLPGLPFFGGTDESRLEYRPYVRGLVDLRRYVPRGSMTFAFKVIAAAAHPTGDSPVVPFDRRFYSGGASSVRGWNFRTLGPGGLTGEGAFVQGGDIKLEASAEARLTFLRRFLGADWQLALFADVGNVWFGPRNPGDEGGRFRFDQFYNELGVGGGYGLRIGWEYLILRFDLGHKVHIPGTDSGLFPEGLGSPLFHFGIGQAF